MLKQILRGLLAIPVIIVIGTAIGGKSTTSPSSDQSQPSTPSSVPTHEEFLAMERNAREVGLSVERFQELKYAFKKANPGASDQAFLSGLRDAAKRLNALHH